MCSCRRMRRPGGPALLEFGWRRRRWSRGDKGPAPQSPQGSSTAGNQHYQQELTILLIRMARSIRGNPTEGADNRREEGAQSLGALQRRLRGRRARDAETLTPGADFGWAFGRERSRGNARQRGKGDARGRSPWT